MWTPAANAINRTSQSPAQTTVHARCDRGLNAIWRRNLRFARSAEGKKARADGGAFHFPIRRVLLIGSSAPDWGLGSGGSPEIYSAARARSLACLLARSRVLSLALSLHFTHSRSGARVPRATGPARESSAPPRPTVSLSSGRARLSSIKTRRPSRLYERERPPQSERQRTAAMTEHFYGRLLYGRPESRRLHF